MSIAQGDRPATYFFIVLGQPMCVDKGREEGQHAVAGVKALQLIFASAKSYAELKPFLGKQVVCSGKLWPQESGHHHSPVLLSSSDCHQSRSG
jgi:hypothetical protein